MEIFELDVDELVGGSVFVGVSDDELQVTQRLFECGQLRLKLVQLADGCYGLVEVRDLWQGVHVLLDFADDLGVEGSLKLQPYPYGQEFLARGVLVIVEDGCTLVEDPSGEKGCGRVEGLRRQLGRNVGQFRDSCLVGFPSRW